MPLESVFFGVDNDRIEYQYDRSKLRLGGRVFVVSDAAGRPVLFSPDPLAGADEYYVQWISRSEWYVPLHRPPKTYPKLVASLSAELGELLEAGLAESAVRILAARVRPAHLFKTSEMRRNPVAALANVCSRLDLCRLLRQPEVERGLGPHHQPLVTYLLLTCFDRLDQAPDWLAFEHWLRSRRHAAEREAAAADIPPGLDPISAARILHESWNARHGASALSSRDST